MAAAQKEKAKTEKAFFSVTMKHSEESFTDLAHAQYDLFCRRNYVVRMLLSAVFIFIGAVKIDKWYSILLIAYGGYLMTSKYSSANHTARKLTKHLSEAGLPFPESEYHFYKERMEVISLPDREQLTPLYYANIVKLASDLRYFYLFRNESGGYMIPKDQLGEEPNLFRDFIEKKTGKTFISRRGSAFSKLGGSIRKRENLPDRLPDQPGSRFRFWK